MPSHHHHHHSYHREYSETRSGQKRTDQGSDIYRSKHSSHFSDSRSRSPPRRRDYRSHLDERPTGPPPPYYTNTTDNTSQTSRAYFKSSLEDYDSFTKTAQSQEQKIKSWCATATREISETGTYKTADPNAELIVRGLSLITTEVDIKDLMNTLGIETASIKVCKDKITGQSKGYAFIKCLDLSNAAYLIQLQTTQPLQIKGMPIRLDYSYTSDASKLENGWYCIKCAIMNFERRDVCFKCKSSKNSCQGVMPYNNTSMTPLKALNDGTQDINPSFSPLLLIIGLDTLTKDETIYYMMSYGGILPRRVWLVKDKISNQSWGFVFIEYTTPQITTSVYEYLASGTVPFYIDNKPVKIYYGRDLYALNNIDAINTTMYPNFDPASMLSYYQKTTLDYWDSSAYLSPYPPIGSSNVSHHHISENTHNPFPFAAASQSNNDKDPLKSFYEELSTVEKDTLLDHSQNESYPIGANKKEEENDEIPKMGNPCDDKASNPSSSSSSPPSLPSPERIEKKITLPRTSKTGLQITPSGLYYDISEATYYFYQTSTKTYIPVNIPAKNNPPATHEKKEIDHSTTEALPDNKEEEKTLKTDMKTTWTKPSLLSTVGNADPSSVPLSDKTSFQPPLPSQEIIKPLISSSKKIHIQLQKWENKQAEASQTTATTAIMKETKPAQKPTTIVAQDDAVMSKEPNFMDTARNACLLCQRQFKSIADLEKHNELSNLHKVNLTAYYEKKRETSESGGLKPKYRNRAEERREKLNMIIAETNLPPPRYLPSHELPEDNESPKMETGDYDTGGPSGRGIGASLMKKMGWKEGEGLGKDQSGIVEPLMAERVIGSKGLGAPNSKITISNDPNATLATTKYATKVQASAMERFYDMK